MSPSTSSERGAFLRSAAVALRNADARATASPVLALAAALAAGFVVGGGLSSRLGRLLFMSAARQGLRRLA
jgi:hypothetical protein